MKGRGETVCWRRFLGSKSMYYHHFFVEQLLLCWALFSQFSQVAKPQKLLSSFVNSWCCSLDWLSLRRLLIATELDSPVKPLMRAARNIFSHRQASSSKETALGYVSFFLNTSSLKALRSMGHLFWTWLNCVAGHISKAHCLGARRLWCTMGLPLHCKQSCFCRFLGSNLSLLKQGM